MCRNGMNRVLGTCTLHAKQYYEESTHAYSTSDILCIFYHDFKIFNGFLSA
ncbi:uncharacterized protein NESG_00020 [Nematocida ausubeli]|uniref:Uncharacterized protein n=1 Tax=Nematocida ausubeli (strain ATCC PRA-371 / ERTm2) TaxID=1913371 RepID=A0A086J483_NEMA1|nr:uncharacterized protein NESG_00020 [Nematocida ausubeli]KFG26951.1 hypothetical protein NESG_00020 [Nematocida ausubeli]